MSSITPLNSVSGQTKWTPSSARISTLTTPASTILFPTPNFDAVVMQRLFTMDRKAWPMDDDETQLLASTRKLLDIVERAQVQLVVFGHDGEQWKPLKKSPQFYERSEEHTSELQSPDHLVCRLLLEKKKK